MSGGHLPTVLSTSAHETTSFTSLDGYLVSRPEITNGTMGNDTNPSSFLCLCYDFMIEAVVMGLLSIFGLLGNTVSSVCLWKDKSSAATPLILVSLEIADNLFLLTVLTLRVVPSVHTFALEILWVEKLSPYMGKYIYPLALLTETGTIYLTILVTVNRYVAVCRPYQASDLCSVANARIHIAIVALFSILFNLPRFFEYEVGEEWSSAKGSWEPKIYETSLMKNAIYRIVYYNLFYFLVMFLVPLVSLAFLNYKLTVALRANSKKRARLLKQKLNSAAVSNRREDDITLMLVVVVMVFVTCQTPAMFTQILATSLAERSCPAGFFFYERISDLLIVINSSTNFIIYCFCSRKFRKDLLRLIKRENSSTSPTGSNQQIALEKRRNKTTADCPEITTHV